MDLFDPFFPNNGRKGWWQKGDTYLHRKLHIDNLFGNEEASDLANIIKLYLRTALDINKFKDITSPIIKTRF